MTTTTSTTRRSHAPLTAADKAQRVQDAHERLIAKVREIQTSEDWTAWLRQASRFHRYSFNNIILIWCQCPEATLVASASKWREMNRWPRKGTKALWIYAPIIVKWTPAEVAAVPARAGQTHLVGFKTVPVFDVSQTDGQPLATDPSDTGPELLDGQAPDVTAQVGALIVSLGYTLTSTPPSHVGALGETDFTTRTITAKTGMSDAQTFKTLMHEIAHANLHDPRVAPEGLTRAVAEVEAESVAYIVCEHFGVKSDAYSFGYVAGWGSRDTDAVIRSGQRITTCAKKIIEALEREGSGS